MILKWTRLFKYALGKGKNWNYWFFKIITMAADSLNPYNWVLYFWIVILFNDIVPYD